MITAAGLLRSQWSRSGDRLDLRLQGLTDAEFWWQPVPDSWTVKEDPAAPSGWTYDYEFPPPSPAPVTTIAWRLVHIAANNWIYWEYAFGPGKWTFPDLAVPSTADDALRNWRQSRDPITAWLDRATDNDLDEMRPSHLGADRSAGEVVKILLDEEVHHGAELALMRDLYLWTTAPPPASPPDARTEDLSS